MTLVIIEPPSGLQLDDFEKVKQDNPDCFMEKKDDQVVCYLHSVSLWHSACEKKFVSTFICVSKVCRQQVLTLSLLIIAFSGQYWS